MLSKLQWSWQSLMRGNSFPRHCVRGSPKPSEIPFIPTDNRHSPKDLYRLRRKKAHTAPLCGRGLSTPTCYFCWEGGEQRVVSVEQTTRDTCRYICVQTEGQTRLSTSLPTPNVMKWHTIIIQLKKDYFCVCNCFPDFWGYLSLLFRYEWYSKSAIFNWCATKTF